MGPRQDRLEWSDHHMLLALVTAQRSPDPNTQVGACIVDQKNRVIALGYNGPPRGMPTNSMPWDKTSENPLETKYPFVTHAEANAILNCAVRNLEGHTLYVTMYPCNECAKLILASNIRRVVYLRNPYEDLWQTKASKKMLDSVDATVTKHKWQTDPLARLSTIKTE
jgi:dCMP deaminase